MAREEYKKVKVKEREKGERKGKLKGHGKEMRTEKEENGSGEWIDAANPLESGCAVDSLRGGVRRVRSALRARRIRLRYR